MIQILLNGEEITIKADIALSDLLQERGITGSHFAVALNFSFVPRQAYVQTILKNGDELEIVIPMQGG